MCPEHEGREEGSGAGCGEDGGEDAPFEVADRRCRGGGKVVGGCGEVEVEQAEHPESHDAQEQDDAPREPGVGKLFAPGEAFEDENEDCEDHEDGDDAHAETLERRTVFLRSCWATSAKPRTLSGRTGRTQGTMLKRMPAKKAAPRAAPTPQRGLLSEGGTMAAAGLVVGLVAGVVVRLGVGL